MNHSMRAKGKATHQGISSLLILRPLFAGIALMLSVFAMTAAADTFNEYHVKAVFLFNLTHFITWPEDAFADEKTPFLIGIAGENPFGDTLRIVLEKEQVNGRRIALITYGNCRDLLDRPCHMLFISKPDYFSCPGLQNIARQHAMVTIGDVPGFLEQGGIINLVKENRRIQIEINQVEAKRMGLEISAQLLNLSRTVKIK